MKNAIFFDKDGTLVPDIPYNVDTDKISIDSQIFPLLRLLRNLGYLFVVVTNQSGIARGYFGVAQLSRVRDKINSILAPHVGELDGFYFCPHHTQGTVPEYSKECICRKPKPGMLLEAAKELDIDLSKSWMVGDSIADILTAESAGCRSILVRKTEHDHDGIPLTDALAHIISVHAQN
jgi:D-glycero-D-manno-heptose 1,7-bisphosphate phosphatase